MKKYLYCSVDITNIEERGWNIDGSIAWILNPYPEDILDLLKNDENKSKDGNNNKEESDRKLQWKVQKNS